MLMFGGDVCVYVDVSMSICVYTCTNVCEYAWLWLVEDGTSETKETSSNDYTTMGTEYPGCFTLCNSIICSLSCHIKAMTSVVEMNCSGV